MTQADSHSYSEQFRRGREELRGLSEEIAGISEDVRNIARTEMELAKAELKEQVALLKTAAIWGGVAAVIAFITLIFAFTALMFALDTAMPLWAAALLTFGLLAAITLIAGGIVYGAAKKMTVVPKKTISSVREDVRWAGTQLKSSVTLTGNETP